MVLFLLMLLQITWLLSHLQLPKRLNQFNVLLIPDFVLTNQIISNLSCKMRDRDRHMPQTSGDQSWMSFFRPLFSLKQLSSPIYSQCGHCPTKLPEYWWCPRNGKFRASPIPETWGLFGFCLFIFCLTPHGLFLAYVAWLSEEAACRRHWVLSSGKIIQHTKALHGGNNHILKCFQ